jgi:hypothetical protein
MALGVGAVTLCVVGFAVVAVLSARALRRDADFDAEMRAASFAFRIRIRPHPPREAPAGAVDGAPNRHSARI